MKKSDLSKKGVFTHSMRDLQSLIQAGVATPGCGMTVLMIKFPGQKARKTIGNVSLSILGDNKEEGRKIFDSLVEGGKVHHAYEKQFWGDWHGSLTDKYGIRWMVNCESK